MSAPDADPAPPAKPRLKINVSRSGSIATDGPLIATPGPVSASTTAATPGEGPRKLKLKVHSSQPPTPAEPTPVKTKAGRQPKPSLKLVESKKRPYEDDDADGVPSSAHPASATTATSANPLAKIRIRAAPKTAPPQVVLKARGRPPVHPPGDGYDSEASDRETDPAIEEQFILRMIPGEHCDYVRFCMENGKMGIPRSQGGADIALKFFEEESRRAVLTVKGQAFAAVMVDLPTITESMKTWDKKSFMKSADICQMLLVFQKARNEDEARHAPLPSPADNSFKWPHGLTPPMHDCVNRRFAKTISRKEIEDKEAEVERLLAEDARANGTKWEWVDERGEGADDEYGADEDAEGEADDSVGYFGIQDSYGAMDNDLEADLEAAFADEGTSETPATAMEGITPMATQGETPAAVQQSIEMDESDEDDDDDDDDDDDLDDDQRAQRDAEQGVMDIINDLKKQLAAREADLAKTQNKILRSRIEQQIKQYKSEIELKKSSIGIETDD